MDTTFSYEADDYYFLDTRELGLAIREAVQNLGTWKSLSSGLIPDECFSKEQLTKMVPKDKKLIFYGPRLQNTLKAQAVLIAKTGSKIVEP